MCSRWSGFERPVDKAPDRALERTASQTVVGPGGPGGATICRGRVGWRRGGRSGRAPQAATRGRPPRTGSPRRGAARRGTSRRRRRGLVRREGPPSEAARKRGDGSAIGLESSYSHECWPPPITTSTTGERPRAGTRRRPRRQPSHMAGRTTGSASPCASSTGPSEAPRCSGSS